VKLGACGGGNSICFTVARVPFAPDARLVLQARALAYQAWYVTDWIVWLWPAHLTAEMFMASFEPFRVGSHHCLHAALYALALPVGQ
jgi:hypothetical protein